MTIVMGGSEKNEKLAAWGGFCWRTCFGDFNPVKSLRRYFSKIETVGDAKMPMLAIINDVSPILGYIHGVRPIRYDIQYWGGHVLFFRGTFHSNWYEEISMFSF